MLARLRALVGGRKPTAAPAVVVTDALPPEVQTIIGAALIIERHGADENSTRTLVQTARGSFWHDAEQSRAWLAANWPDLNPAQQSRALSMLGSHVVQTKREQAAAAVAVRRTSSWRDWQAAPKPWPHSPEME